MTEGTENDKNSHQILQHFCQNTGQIHEKMPIFWYISENIYPQTELCFEIIKFHF